jgi:hypothetical protein
MVVLPAVRDWPNGEFANTPSWAWAIFIGGGVLGSLCAGVRR